MSELISHKIFNAPMLGSGMQFSSAAEIDNFFAQVPAKARDAWPFDLQKDGYDVHYLGCMIDGGWKEAPRCTLTVEVGKDQQKALIEQKFAFGLNDNLIINIESVNKPESGDYPQGLSITQLLSRKNFAFIKQYDKIVKPVKPSCVEIYASSEMTKQGVQTCGGYVWANNGFEFKDKEWLKMTRAAFKQFTAQYGVTLSDRDLKNFTSPCHFAAYGCGVMAEVDGRKYRLGKAFLLQHSWRGILSTAQEHGTAQKFANAYNSERLPLLKRKKGFAVLSLKYQALVKQGYKKNLLSQIADKFKAYRRLLKQKLSDSRQR